MKAQKIVIAGGTGLLGQVLIEELSADHEIIILTRRPAQNKGGIIYLNWDGKNMGEWRKEFEGALAVINLSGHSVDCRHNAKNKKLIMDSRVDSTRVIGEAINQCSVKPLLWVNASSAAFYVQSHIESWNEDGPAAKDFSGSVVEKWESAFFNSNNPGVRKAVMRITIVLSNKGGIIPIMRRLVKMGLGGTQGSGKQFISWIHERDFASMVRWIIGNESVKGVLNMAAPNPVTNKTFMRMMRRNYGVPIGLPAYTPFIYMGAWFMRTEAHLVLNSRKVIPGRSVKAGYEFQFVQLNNAINDLSNGD